MFFNEVFEINSLQTLPKMVRVRETALGLIPARWTMFSLAGHALLGKLRLFNKEIVPKTQVNYLGDILDCFLNCIEHVKDP